MNHKTATTAEIAVDATVMRFYAMHRSLTQIIMRSREDPKAGRFCKTLGHSGLSNYAPNQAPIAEALQSPHDVSLRTQAKATLRFRPALVLAG